jgi:hypothetical protein
LDKAKKKLVNWNTQKNEFPIVFQKREEWSWTKPLARSYCTGRSAGDSSGDAQNYYHSRQDSGSFPTKQQPPTANSKKTPGQFCMYAAGQSFSARWKEEFEYLMFNIEPIFLAQISGISGDV